MLQEHADKLLLEPATPARDRQISRIVDQAIRICNRIKDSSEEDQEVSEVVAVKRAREQEECQRLARLYDLKSIVMSVGEMADGTDSTGYAAALVDKGDALARMMGREEDALLTYDQALVILGYDDSITAAQEAELADALQVAQILNKKGLLLMQQSMKAGKNVADFDQTLSCFAKGRKIAEQRADIQRPETCQYFSLSADMLESEGVCCQHLERSDEAVQKFEESLARKISISETEISEILMRLRTIFNGTETPASTNGPATVARVLSLLCKKRPSELLSAGKHGSDIDSVMEVVEQMRGADSSAGYSFLHIQEWGAACLSAFWMMDIQQSRAPYFTASDVDSAIHALLSALRGHRNHANIVQHTMQALLSFADKSSLLLSSKLRDQIILTVLGALDMHKSNINVQEPGLKCIQHWLNLDPRAFLIEQHDENEVRALLTALVDAAVAKMQSDTHVINKCLDHGAVKTLLSCLENETAADSALEILVTLSVSDGIFAKAMAYSGAQGAIERAMKTHASHENIQKNATVCMDKCREWFSKALEQRDGM